MWKDMGFHFTLIALPSSLLVSVLSIHLPHNWLEFEQISVELFQRPVTQEPKECLWVTDGDRNAYMLMFNKPTKILSNGQFLLAQCIVVGVINVRGFTLMWWNPHVELCTWLASCMNDPNLNNVVLCLSSSFLSLSPSSCIFLPAIPRLPSWQPFTFNSLTQWAEASDPNQPDLTEACPPPLPSSPSLLHQHLLTEAHNLLSSSS